VITSVLVMENASITDVNASKVGLEKIVQYLFALKTVDLMENVKMDNVFVISVLQEMIVLKLYNI
jgi:hypothetical protein